MILAVISDTPCVAFDNSTGKVSGVFPWIQDYAVLADNKDEFDAFDLMKRAVLKKEKAGEYEVQEIQFEEMAECIRAFWELGVS